MIIDNKTITTVVSDFDGTIIKPGMNEPPRQFFRVVEKLMRQNIQFIAASGRQYPNLRRILAPIAEHIGFIAENGALIMWQGKILHKSVMDRGLAMELIHDMGKQPDSEILVSGEGTSYIVPNDPSYTYLLEHRVKNVVSVLKDFSQISEDLLKVSIYYPGGIPRSSEEYFHKEYDARLLIVESGNGWLDFMPRESGKGPALRILSEKMGFALEQTVSFGDSENDISMLQATGISYAMSSAEDRVKRAADHVCDSVEDTLLQAINEVKMPD